MALTAKQKTFVQEYLIDLNATQAAIRAGYSPETAKEIGYENLTKPHIKKAIDRAMTKRSERTEITADRVLQELAKIGFANITDYLKVTTEKQVIGQEDNGEKIIDFAQTVQFFDTDQVERTKLDAVSEIKQTKDGVSLKMHDKVSALEKMGRHLGMFKDNINVNVTKKLEDFL